MADATNLDALDAATTPSSDAELSQLIKTLAAVGIHVIDGDKFLAKELPPPVWIVPGLVAKHYLCALYGKSKTKKTFFVLDFARHVATGRKFLNLPTPDEPHKVAYINIELMPYFMQERMKRQSGDLKAEMPYGGNLMVFNCRGAGPELRNKGNEIKRLCQLMGIELVIIDPRYKLMQDNEDENSAAGLRALLDFRTKLAEVAAVLLVSHDPKGDVSNKALLDRGAGSYTAIADDDATILLTPNTNGETDKDALTVEVLHRNRAPLDPFVAVFDPNTETFAVDDTISADTSLGQSTSKMSAGQKAERNREKMEQFTKAALEVAEEHGDDLIDCDTFKTEITHKPNGTVFGAISSKAFRAAWNTLLAGKEKKLSKCPILEKKPDGTFGKGRMRQEYVSTPERIDRYISKFKVVNGSYHLDHSAPL